ncbi:MAG: deoxyribodipyrimidine photolyase [bacterium]
MTIALRLARRNEAPIRPERDYVLYWMIAARRTRWNHGLEYAARRARELGRPLLVFEPLRAGYEWASHRLHRFVIEGMVDNAAACARAGVTYFPYVEPEDGAGHGLLEALASRACVVVADEYPVFFLPRMVAAAAKQLDVALGTVDSNGVLPLRATTGDFPTAHSFRRFLQRNLTEHLLSAPAEDPLAGLRVHGAAEIPADVSARWPAADLEALTAPGGLDSLPIDASVPPAPVPGGPRAAERALRAFVEDRLERYGEERSHPDSDASSELSPWLHFGHLSAHEAVAAVLSSEGWSPDRLSSRTDGSRAGWWGVGESAESFLDELVTWRELGHVFAFHRPHDYDRYSSLPDWARKTLAEHAGDPRPERYDLAALRDADTADPIWNAAQRQLLQEGRMHNYLRMLWGKKILEWSRSPEDALDVMIELNNRYALDGRDPNSYSGIFWVLGRFDRAWGPEREIYGKIRYMTSDSTARKLRLKHYLARWSEPALPLDR